MAWPASPSLIERFSAPEDPRQSWKVLYPLPEALLVVLCGTLAGAEGFVGFGRWGGVNLAFPYRFLPYAAGLPGHGTLNDVMRAIDGDLFLGCFTAWVEGLREGEDPGPDGPEVVVIDGETSRRTHDWAKGRGPLHLVSAWASSQSWTRRSATTSADCDPARGRRAWQPCATWP